MKLHHETERRKTPNQCKSGRGVLQCCNDGSMQVGVRLSLMTPLPNISGLVAGKYQGPRGKEALRGLLGVGVPATPPWRVSFVMPACASAPSCPESSALLSRTSHNLRGWLYTNQIGV